MSNNNFTLIEEREIPQQNSRGFLYRHNKTGAEVLSICNKDENKVFGISFKTPVDDSTGVPHILEHSVLCGSKKYPVKEPFVELLKGSLQTFLNAFTFPDKTCYPVASQNVQDFYNLIDVYIDAVFYPRITPEIFAQEGHHLELKDKNDLPIYKGVVYNEMQGAYASPERILMEEAQHSLFPDTTYGFESGGDPEIIPELTYEQFKQFHADYYHPSNSRIFFYGDDDPEKRLELVEEYLNEFDKSTSVPKIKTQGKIKNPEDVVQSYATNEDNGKGGYFAMNWLLPETTSVQENFALHILEKILIGSSASPLRKALLDSNLGDDITGIGLEDEIKELYFSTGLKGINPEDAPQVEALILETLEEITADGIDPELVEATVNKIEFTLKENNQGSFPRGIVTMLTALNSWLYGKSPFLLLDYKDTLEKVKSKLQDKNYLPSLITKYFIKNKNRTSVLLKPDFKLSQAREAKMSEKMKAIKEKMSTDEIDELIKETNRLIGLQGQADSAEALATIPALGVKDLDKKTKIIHSKIWHQDPVVLTHSFDTNGITYVDIGFKIDAVPEELVSYLAIYGNCLLKMGTEVEDYTSFSKRVNKETGGISFQPVILSLDDKTGSTSHLFFRGKALDSKIGKLFAIFEDFLTKPNFGDRGRLKQIFSEQKAGLENGIIPSGHRFVEQRLRASLTPINSFKEKISGIDYFFFLKETLENFEEKSDKIIDNLKALHEIIISKDNSFLNITGDQQGIDFALAQIPELQEALPDSQPTKARQLLQPIAGFEGFSLPGGINYVSKGINLYENGFNYSGAVAVIIRHLRTSFLWDKVRVQGGAYGAFASFDRLTGVISFASYRDPNLKETLDIYDAVTNYLLNVELTPEEIGKDIIGTIGDLDGYLLPDQKGFSSVQRYLMGLTDEKRQTMRDEVLNTSIGDFRLLGKALRDFSDQGKITVLGSKDKIGEFSKLDERLVAKELL